MERWRSRSALGLLILGGVALRVALVLRAENQLDCDESTVGLMVLDVLERGARPFFFTGNHHNGGAAFEAYLGALVFAAFGASSAALKLTLLGLWTAAALLFADLCRRALAGIRPFAALLFFGVATPFFLEWSLKARGGYAETVLVSALLLWLAHPPPVLARRPYAAALAFGVASGIGLWASQMLLPLLPCAAVWLLARREEGERLRALATVAVGALVGLGPLVVYNALHEASHLREAAPALFLRSGSLRPLSPEHLWLSLRFALGPALGPLLAGLAVGGISVLRRTRGVGLGRACLAHLLLYVAAYELAGLRHLPIPPSRLLYALYPSLAVVLACALPPRPGLRSAGGAVAAGGVALWLALSAAPVADWLRSGHPRETGSWRASWCLVDGAGLYRALIREGVEVVYVPRWTEPPLRFATRLARRADPAAQPLEASFGIPRKADAPAVRAAFALPRETRVAEAVRELLRSRAIAHRLATWGDFVILADLDAARIHREGGFPRRILTSAWRPVPRPPDGFN